jgi:glycosyltransferase involved in cell wall biosynthesis
LGPLVRNIGALSVTRTAIEYVFVCLGIVKVFRFIADKKRGLAGRFHASENRIIYLLYPIFCVKQTALGATGLVGTAWIRCKDIYTKITRQAMHMWRRPLVIVHTESHRGWGGQELRVLTECSCMKQKGHRPILVASRKSKLYPKAKAAGLETLPMSFTNLTALGDLIRLRSWLKKTTPDVFNTHGNVDAKVGLLAAAGLKIPCVIRSRHHSHPVSSTWYNKWMYRHLSHYVFTTADCTSQQIIRDLSLAPAKVVTVGSGIIPPESLIDRQSARHRLQKELHVSSQVRFLGSVAMMGSWKGQRYIIDGFAQICKAFPRHHLVFVGDGSEMDRLKHQAARLGLSDRIHLTGFKKDPWPYFRAFDLDILASTKNEGIPQVLL